VSIAEFFEYLFKSTASTELACELVEVYSDRRERALIARAQLARH
jgi:hypothetical protein